MACIAPGTWGMYLWRYMGGLVFQLILRGRQRRIEHDAVPVCSLPAVLPVSMMDLNISAFGKPLDGPVDRRTSKIEDAANLILARKAPAVVIRVCPELPQDFQHRVIHARIGKRRCRNDAQPLLAHK